MGSKRSSVVWIVAAVVIVAVVVGVVIARSNNKASDKSSSNSTSSQSSSNSSSDSSAAPKAVATNKVDIKDFAFSPAAIKVKVGTTVTWTNDDSTAHTVTADSGTGPDSGNLDPGKSYSFTYKSVGTFSYHCNIHSNMTGTVQVTQ